MRTENGALSIESTMDARLNLFFKTVRNIDSFRLFNLIDKSWEVDKLHTMKILLNWRDCRGGKGDYNMFIDAMEHIAKKEPEWLHVNIDNIPEYGRFLDLVKIWHVVPTSQTYIMKFLVDQLINDHESTESISLLAKWIPTEKKQWDKGFVKALCKVLFNTDYVKSNHIKRLRTEYITPLRAKLKIIEHNLVNRDYTFPYEAVPSCAMKKYKKAFTKNDGVRFTSFIEDVKSGKKKINASQVYPHDLVCKYIKGDEEDAVIEEQWKVISENVTKLGAFDQSVVVCDVSGSMQGTPMEVAIALGLLSKNKLITFSEYPRLHDVPYHESLHKQVKNVMNMDWGCNTNLEKVIDLLVKFNEPIKRVYIFSDMQFDAAVSCNDTHFDQIKKKFGESMPQIIFWNLRGDTSDFPAQINDNGVVMLSGYSPSLLKMITNAEDINPLNAMLSLIESDRYSKVRSPTNIEAAIANLQLM